MAAVLPVALVAGFFWGEMKVGMAMQTENGTALQEIARELAGKSVYSIDGALYDQAKIDARQLAFGRRGEPAHDVVSVERFA